MTARILRLEKHVFLKIKSTYSFIFLILRELRRFNSNDRYNMACHKQNGTIMCSQLRIIEYVISLPAN